MPNGDCPVGAAHSQQIRLLEESVERMDRSLSQKADVVYLERMEERVDKISNMFWALITLIIANLIGVILMLLKISL